MRALSFLVLCTFTCVWTINIFIDGPVVLLDCGGHDRTKTSESTTTSHPTEASEEPKVPSEGRIFTIGNEEFLVVTTQKLTLGDARAWCQQQWGGDLAEPSDLQALADRMMNSFDVPIYADYLVGANGVGTAGAGSTDRPLLPDGSQATLVDMVTTVYSFGHVHLAALCVTTLVHGQTTSSVSDRITVTM